MAGGENEAADRALVAVDGVVTCGEGGVVTRGEGVGGVSEEGDDRSGAAEDGGELQGVIAEPDGCAQRQRVLADQELENGGVAVVVNSPMKGRPPAAGGEASCW